MANRLRCKKCAASYKGEGGPSAAWLASYGRNGWPVMAGMGGQLRPECPASYGRNLHLRQEVALQYCDFDNFLTLNAIFLLLLCF